MMAFPSMLVDAAAQAGMKVPPDADDFDVEAREPPNENKKLQIPT